MEDKKEMISELKNITKAIGYAASKIEHLSVFGLPKSINPLEKSRMEEEFEEQEKLRLEEKKIQIDENQITELIKQNQILKITVWVTAIATIIGALINILPTILKFLKII